MHSTSKLEDGYLGSGKILWYSIRKHGKAAHTKEILEFLQDRESLKKREFELVTLASLADPICMNLKIGGEGGFPPGVGLIGFMNTEHQLKCSSAGGRTTNPAKSQKARELMNTLNKNQMADGSFRSIQVNCNWLGRQHKTETKDRIAKTNSIKQGGSSNSQFGTKWMTHPENGTVKVSANEVPKYLELGYFSGRKKADK
jgi:hypothetical protein